MRRLATVLALLCALTHGARVSAEVADAEARQQARHDCERGFAPACARLADYYALGVGGPIDGDAQLAALERACALGDQEGCNNLGWSLARGTSRAKNPQRARELFAASCAKDNLHGCDGLAQAWRDGIGGPIDLNKASQIWATACARSDGSSCHNLGDALLLFTVPPALAEARHRFEQGCALKWGESCSKLGLLWLRGLGGDSDRDRAREYWTVGCDLENGASCHQLATVCVEDDPTKARALEERARRGWEKACARGSALDCLDLGRSWQLEGTLDRNPQKALRSFALGCRLGAGEACEAQKSIEAAKTACAAECRRMIAAGALRAGVTLDQCIAATCSP